MDALKKGYKYELKNCSGEGQFLSFVEFDRIQVPNKLGFRLKRIGDGTSASEVIKALIDHLTFLNNQACVSEVTQAIVNLHYTLRLLSRVNRPTNPF